MNAIYSCGCHGLPVLFGGPRVGVLGLSLGHLLRELHIRFRNHTRLLPSYGSSCEQCSSSGDILLVSLPVNACHWTGINDGNVDAGNALCFGIDLWAIWLGRSVDARARNLLLRVELYNFFE